MKKTILSILFLPICFYSFGQKESDNEIIVHGFVSYNQIKSALFDEGFISTNTDTSFISTNSKRFASGSNLLLIMDFDMQLLIKKNDTSVIFKGEMTLISQGGGMKNPDIKGPIQYSEKKPAKYAKKGFMIINKIAKSFGFPVTYLHSN